MLARIARSLIAFGVVFAAYQAYALLAVPVVEPTIARKQPAARTGADSGNPASAVTRYQRLLANYFPADHWTLTGLPKVIRSGKMMLVIDDYERDNRGRVDLTRCVAIMFPTPWRLDGPAPGDAVVFEAPGGARLQFDDNFQPSRGKIGRVTNGEFPGPITIRSGMRDPGPEDDLLITTRDLRMNESLAFTPHEVSVRHGRSVGGGKRMEIRLLEEKHARKGLRIAGVESIEIFEQVKLSLQLGNINPLREDISGGLGLAPPARMHVVPTAFTPEEDAAAWAGAAASRESTPRRSVYATRRPQRAPAPADSEPPLEITCAGSFRMNLTRFVAAFNHRVHAWQMNLDGQSDQLTCRELRLYFGAGAEREAVEIDPQRDPAVAQRQRRVLARLQPRRMEAVGEPVRIDSPTRDARARGRALTFDFQTRRLTLDGDALVERGESSVVAPLIQYAHPAKGSPDAIGQMWVAGPGRLRAVAAGSRGHDGEQRAMVARWAKTPGVEFPVTLLRDDRNQPRVKIVGRPVFEADGVGKVAAERVTVSLREAAPDGPAGPAIELGSGGTRRALLPERIDAAGRVEVDSPKLSAATDTLTVWIKGQPEAAPMSPTGGPPGGWPEERPARRRAGGPAPQSGDRFRLVARRSELDVVMAGKRAEAKTLRCSGAVDFRELTPARGEEPLRVRGERMTVAGLATRALLIDIRGAPRDANPTRDPAKATITARGITLHAGDAHIDQANNRMWADGPGDAHVQTARDFLGQQTAAATDLNLEWRGGWVFDGRQIKIRDDVFGEGPHDWVRTNELIATLTRPVTLGKSAAGGGRIEIAEIECRGGVTLDHRTLDPRGQTSQERANLRTLKINQQTGELSGAGPGWVRSVRLSSSGNPLGAAVGGGAGRAKKEGLRLLRVHFQTGVAGNFKDRARRINFAGRVRAIYGPVLSWQQDMPVIPHESLPPDTATLACDQLQVAEDPMAKFNGSAATAGGSSELAPLELIAAGSVRLEGSADDGTVFNAQSSRASFNQSKELFILEGDGRSRATLWVQKPGQGTLKYPAGKISYWQKTGKVLTDNFGGVNYAPTAARPAAAAPTR
ncbi:MAG: hypothetical protein AAGB00_06880 [Planctomycetota bacterium]